jgi:hypothetical protein
MRANLLVASACALAACSNPNGAEDALPQPSPGADAPAPAPTPASTPRGSPAAVPMPAPDTARIAFAARLGDAPSLDVYSMKPDGTDVRRLTDTPDNDETFPSWSPDHAQIAYVRDDQLFVMNADGSNARLVAGNVGREGYAKAAPAWSPDGRQLLYPHARDATQGGATLLHRVAEAGTGDAAFEPDATSIGSTLSEPAWSSAGVISFLRSEECAGCSDTASIVTVLADGSSYARKAMAAMTAHGIDFAPDGAELVYAMGSTSTASGYEIPGRIVVSTALDGGGVVLVPQGAWMPRWSPTGEHIAYLMADGIHVLTRDGAGARMVFQKSGVRGIDW